MGKKEKVPKKPKRLLTKPIRRLLAKYRVDRPKHFRLKHVDPADTAGFSPSDVDEDALARGAARLAALQAKLNAEDRWSVLLVFQAMDAAGKDSTIDHVLSGVNPAGCQVFSFRAPSAEELDHDFLWRHVRCLPERGRIGIFNRSWYEEVLVARVHPEVLAREKLPPELVTKDIWEQRYDDINAFERYLARNGTLVLKFFLHLSKEEQRRRFLARIDEPSKNWKFSLGDVSERQRWDEYMSAYEKMIRRTSTPHAPWHVIPADNKWFTRVAVAATVVMAIDGLKPDFPEFDESKRAELDEARRRLLREDRRR
jgi:PPK2 family polyphosphate:nucleotide phosphotransferase